MELQHMEKKVAEKTAQSFNRTDHLANERTFLAWIRISIGIMAFGFVVEKFSFFMKQIASFLATEGLPVRETSHSLMQSYSSIFGIFLVGLGALICLLAFIKFKNVEKQINDETYRPSLLLDAMLTLFVFFIGMFLVIYLANSL
jgi:putative membrane protein